MGDYYGNCPPYEGGYGNYAGASQPGLDIFIKKAVEVKRILPSLFNIKVVGDIIAYYNSRITKIHPFLLSTHVKIAVPNLRHLSIH